MTAKCIRGLAVGAVGVLVIQVLSCHAVGTEVSEEDARVIGEIIVPGDLMHGIHRSFSAEIVAIEKIQRAVLDAAPGNVGIPYDHSREPKELLEARSGLCFDRSRAIEKALRYVGFQARHVAIYSTKETGSALKSLALEGTPSHAVSEVLTSRGWLVVDSNAPWLSIDIEGRPVSIRAMASAARRGALVEYGLPIPTSIYREPFVAVFGLYARHGRFYPPYDFIPDVNYGEFAQNFW